MMEQLELAGALRTTLEERFQALRKSPRTEESRAEGIEQERKLLRRVTKRQVGA